MKYLFLAGVLTMSGLIAQEPDNTKTNKRDRARDAITADQQSMSPEDRELARKIRKSVYDDKSLSTYAHNVKIIVREGTVTLRGPVRDASEKDNIGRKAGEIAGAAKVTNELEIAPDKK
jgi:hyperosmotically inducible protein